MGKGQIRETRQKLPFEPILLKAKVPPITKVIFLDCDCHNSGGSISSKDGVLPDLSRITI